MGRDDGYPQDPHKTANYESSASRERLREQPGPMAHTLLLEAALTFRGYEARHRAKLSPSFPEAETSAGQDTLAKANRNADIAARIERCLDDQRRSADNSLPGFAPTDASAHLRGVAARGFGTTVDQAVRQATEAQKWKEEPHEER